MEKTKKRILVINPFGIGDLLFSTPLLKNLKFFYPDARITVLTAKRSALVLENNPSVDEVIPFNRGDFKEEKKKSKAEAYRKLFQVLSRIATARFDLYVDLSLEHRYSLFAKILGVKPRLGYNYRKRGRFLTDKVDVGGFAGRHVVEYHLDLMRLFGLKPRFKNTELFISQEEKKWANDFLQKHGVSKNQTLVFMAPGGGKSWQDKAWYLQWPEEKFTELARKLKENNKIKIILVGDRQDEIICNRIASVLGEDVLNVCGKINLRNFFAVLKEADIVICNDTGILHIASALERKIVCLCGPVDERAYGPYPPAKNKVVVSKDFACRPCYSGFKVSECKEKHKCLRQIEVSQVFDKIKDLLLL